MLKALDFQSSTWDNISFELPSDIPSMISPQERRYLYWIANKYFQQIGEIVEVGTWLGGSTACLASGLIDRNSHQQLYCYDNYVWTKSYESKSGGIRLQEGADFQPIFHQFISNRFHNVRSFKSSLSELEWLGNPIEVLFLDAPKNKSDMISSVKSFFPHLIPGVSTVIFQDFFYSPAYDISATIFKLGSSLELLHVVENSSTAAFRFASNFCIDYDDLDYSSIPVPVLVDKYSETISVLPPASGDFLSISLAMLLSDLGNQDEAIDVLLARDLCDSGYRRFKYLSSMSYLRDRYQALFQATVRHHV